MTSKTDISEGKSISIYQINNWVIWLMLFLSFIASFSFEEHYRLYTAFMILATVLIVINTIIDIRSKSAFKAKKLFHYILYIISVALLIYINNI
jgi:hypothetical protein